MGLVATFAPADMESILTSFSWFDVSSASPNVVLHANGFVGLPKFDLAIRGDDNFPLAFAFAFALGDLGVIVLDNRFVGRSSGQRLNGRLGTGGTRQMHHMILHFRVHGPALNCIINWLLKSIALNF